MGNTESTFDDYTNSNSHHTLKRVNTTQSSECDSKVARWTNFQECRHIASHIPSIPIDSAPWTYIGDEALWQDLWRGHPWSLDDVESIRSLFKVLKERSGVEGPNLPTRIIDDFMVRSNPFLSTMTRGAIGLIITVGQSRDVSETQFLRLASLCDVSTPHEIPKASGSLRLALIFAMYDRDLKGYLDEQDFTLMKHDVVSIYGAQSPLLPVSIMNLIAKVSPYLEPAKYSFDFNNPKIDFELFKATVETQVMRGTSQLMRARFQQWDSILPVGVGQEQQQVPQAMIASDMWVRTYQGAVSNSSTAGGSIFYDSLQQTMSGPAINTANIGSFLPTHR